MTLYKPTHKWEEQLFALTRQCIIEDPFGLIYLYENLSNQAAEWINNHQYGIQIGDSFYVPLDNGNQWIFTFHGDVTQLEIINPENGKSFVGVSLEESANKDYRSIEALEKLMRLNKYKLGYAPSMDFFEFKVYNPGDRRILFSKNKYDPMGIAVPKKNRSYFCKTRTI